MASHLSWVTVGLLPTSQRLLVNQQLQEALFTFYHGILHKCDKAYGSLSL